MYTSLWGKEKLTSIFGSGDAGGEGSLSMTPSFRIILTPPHVWPHALTPEDRQLGILLNML